MIAKFNERWLSKRSEAEAIFAAKHPDSYLEIVTAVVRLLHVEHHESPDYERITEIDHGHYQGTLVYIVAETDYQPSTYWATSVYYGSCSGCDTLQKIQGYDGTPPTAEQVAEYMTLALHIVQSFRQIAGYTWNDV